MEIQYPFDKSFQRKILALMVRDPQFLSRYPGVIRSRYFHGPLLQTLSKTIIGYHEQTEEALSLDGMMVELDRAKRQYGMKDDLYDALVSESQAIYRNSDLSDITLVRERAIEFARAEELRLAFGRVVTELEKPTDEQASFDEQIEWLLEADRVGYDVQELGTNYGSRVQNLPDYLRSTSYNPARRVQTPFPALNSLTFGGFGRGELVMVLGLSGAGKTMVCMNIAAHHLLYGKGTVLHYTIGDLDEADVALRYAARMTGCTMREIIANDPVFRQRYQALQIERTNLWIKQFTPGTTRVGQIRSHLSTLVAANNFHPSMIVMDYPDQLRGATGEGMYAALGEIYDELIGIAKQFDLVMVVPSQVSRVSRYASKMSKNEVLTQDHVANSSQKTAKADVVMSINQNGEERVVGHARLWLDKCRRGKDHQLIPLAVDFSRATITERDKEEGEGDEQG